MARRQIIPDVLKQGQVSIAEAETAGVSRHQLRGPNGRRIGRDRVVWTGLRGSERRESAPALPATVPGRTVFSHRTAALIHGVDLGALPAIEVTTPPGSHVWPRVGWLVRHAVLNHDDVTQWGGRGVTSRVRTAFDLARHLDRPQRIPHKT